MNFELSSFYSNYNLGCKGSEKSRIMQEFVAFLKKSFRVPKNRLRLIVRTHWAR